MNQLNMPTEIMKSYRGYVKNILDMERLVYGPMAQEIQKADAPIITSTTGVLNRIFGKFVWVQLNQEANAFGVLPKLPHTRSGWRVITARGLTKPSGGVAENAALPDTAKPTFAEVSTLPKTVAHNFDTSEIQDFLAVESDDDAIGDLDFQRQYWGTEHKEHMNSMLLTENGTLASDNFESIDRVCGNNDEITNNTQADDGAYTAGDLDIYGLDRDAAAAWHDAVVDDNNGTDRAITDGLIRGVRRQVVQNGANPTFWLTGHDTYSNIIGLYDPQVRYGVVGQATFKVGVNGIETKEGFGMGVDVATLYGLPLIISQDVVSDTISRLYILDTSNPEGFDYPRLFLRIARPTEYFQAGIRTGDPFGINRLGTEGMYRTAGELICTFFKVQGKLRDLK